MLQHTGLEAAGLGLNPHSRTRAWAQAGEELGLICQEAFPGSLMLGKIGWWSSQEVRPWTQESKCWVQM